MNDHTKTYRASNGSWTATCHSGFAAMLFDANLAPQVSQVEWEVMAAMPGWCRREKAEAMVRLITLGHVRTVVEVGVYGGRSLQAMALGLAAAPVSADLIDPMLVGIDPWNPAYIGEIADQLLRDVTAHMRARWPRVMLLRAPSESIVQFGRAVDLVHIDGDHTPPAPLVDVQAWYPRVRHLGYMVMDDANYGGVVEATTWLEQQGAELLCDVTYADVDGIASVEGGWRLYQITR